MKLSMYLLRQLGLGSMSQSVGYLNVVNGIDATVMFLNLIHNALLFCYSR